MQKTLTVGKPWRVILLFALPLMLGNVVQQLYQVVDAMVVGQHLGVDALAAVGTTSGLLFLLTGFAWGTASGLAIPTAQAFGAGDYAAVRRSVAAGTVLAGAISIAITAIGTFFARDLLVLLQTPESLLDEATVFATVTFAGSVATMFFNYLSSIIRAIGDSRTPLIFLVIACFVNMGLVVGLVGFAGLGVGGAAASTVAAQILSVILCFVYLRRSIPVLCVKREDWRPGMKEIGRHLQIGLPMGFQASIIAIGALAVQIRLNTIGEDAVAAYTTAARLDGLAVGILNSIGIAVSTFVAQNYGAGLFSRILVGVRDARRISIGIALAMAAILITAGDPIIRGFVGSGSDDVVTMAHEYLVVNGSLYFLLGILFVTRAGLQGMGDTLIPTISGILELSMRIVAAVVLGGIFGFVGIIWDNPLAWFGALLILLPSWMSAKKKLKARAANEPLIGDGSNESRGTAQELGSQLSEAPTALEAGESDLASDVREAAPSEAILEPYGDALVK